MSVFKRLFASKESKAVLGVLDEADQRFDCAAFALIKPKIEKATASESEIIAQQMKSGVSARQIVYAAIANFAIELVESGQFHIYRGVLNPLTGGEDLLRIFDAAADVMVEIGAIDPEYAQEQKDGLRENIRTVG